MSKTLTHPDVLTPEEAARFLRVKKATVLRLARQGEVPARKIDDEWRFLRAALEEWLRGTPNSRQIFLSQVGAFKDDETLMPMLEEIYKARGRPMIDDENGKP